MALYLGKEMIGEVDVSMGQGKISLQNKTVSPTKTVQTVTADAAYDGLYQVTVQPISDDYIEKSETQTYYLVSSVPSSSFGKNGDLCLVVPAE